MRLVDPEVWKLDLLLFHGCNEKTAWLIDRINHAPTIDAVPVIRCKDCKFSMSGIDKYNERYILCQLHERSYGVIDDGFCSWAERKDKNDSCQSV